MKNIDAMQQFCEIFEPVFTNFDLIVDYSDSNGDYFNHVCKVLAPDKRSAVITALDSIRNMGYTPYTITHIHGNHTEKELNAMRDDPRKARGKVVELLYADL